MNTHIRFGRVSVAVGIACIIALFVFHAGKKKIEQEDLSPVVQSEKTVSLGGEKEAVSKTYKNNTYGFGIVFAKELLRSTECPSNTTSGTRANPYENPWWVTPVGKLTGRRHPARWSARMRH